MYGDARMMRRSGPGLLLAALAILCVSPSVSRPAENVAVEWRFDKVGDLRGWAVGGHIRQATVSGGALMAETSDWDPILFGPVFEITATPTQCVEIKMRTPRGGSAQLFWTETLQGQYGGFSQQKCCGFETRSGDEFGVYRVYPFWHSAGKIIRLRLDPPATGKFAIEWIRIVDEGSPTRSAAKAWRFESATDGWRAWQDVSEPAIEAGRLRVTAQGKSPILMSPWLSVSADENPYVSIRMAANRGTSGRVFCVCSTQFGWEDVAFRLRADGQLHSYNIDVGHLGGWRDQIIMLGIQPTDSEGADVSIESIEIANAPRGPAELEIGYFGPAEGINRTGRPAEVTVSVRNLGGVVDRDVVATLVTPEGLRTIGSPRQTIEKLTPWLPQAVSWQVEASRPERAQVAVKLASPNARPIASTAVIEFTPAPEVPPTSYIPEPQPVKSPYDIGAFYFPGWNSMSRWQPILDYPMRKPVLGWYDESNPECADWQIKWAVEHGITFFMVDWYWCQGNRHLEHWLHDAYMKARFRKYLKWAVMWANHNPPNTHSADDWRKVTQYWIDHYFGMEEYYRIDGRPAVFIWAPAGIRHDVGGSEEAAKLYAMSQQMARDAGLPGIYFVAMSSHQSEAACRQLKTEGYQACTSYHGFQLAAQRAGSKRFPFADVVETSPQVWRDADQRASGLLYMPIVDTGWASEPWHGNKSLVISDRTPQQFGRLCRAARAYAEETQKKIITVGPCNEWGEGSYIEPYAEYGFADLDQLRAAYCPAGDWPPNLIPADVGRGPYDLPQLAPKTTWQFNTDGDFEGWIPNGYLKAEVRGDLLVGETTGHDPILQGPGVRIEANRTRRLIIRMRSDTDDRAQLFWATATSSQSEGNSVQFPVVGDGQFHDYE
ncbi:MAG: glycoside hydrolase family 99-like domain-containing protein, partial [Planctomycetes bacterium]|nr:glycoside hydrolase family 99-like domain-containing protein [Planctomycetota bacterium]